MNVMRQYISLLLVGLIMLRTGMSWAQNNFSFINKNVIAGSGAGLQNNGTNGVFLGASAGYSNTTGAGNVFIGAQAGFSNTTSGANVFLGTQAGFSTTTGVSNVLVGNSAGYSNMTGQNNMFLGSQAGYNNTTGSYNLFMGNATGSSTTTGGGNTAIGDGSLLKNTTGAHNTAIGEYAGIESRNDENVFIGFASDVNTATPNLTNVTAIGARARVSQSNSVVLGNNANVGIGTTAPNAKLEVVSGTSGVSGLRLSSLGTTATMLSQTKFLTINGQGDVVLGSITGSARLGADGEGLWQTEGNTLQNTNMGGVVIGKGISKTPAGYQLYVADGILTEKVKVALKSTDEWADSVFDKSYPLKSLSDVQRYIQSNKHLPGIPSADDMVKQGLDVAKMDAKLLEKIEELTLYSIQLQNELKAIKQQRHQDQQEVQLMKQRQAQLEKLIHEVIKQK